MTSHRIHALPLHLANQIAAGEVVERPASVLKELVENSIDAGATQIDIRIEGAGRQLIQVTDNGNGIHQDDLLLALSRHATSKLSSSEQLSQIASLGFRGEALPSIASVSRLTLISKQANEECGWQIDAQRKEIQPAAHANGTTVSMAELFFNLPARRHFLRSDKTELHHLQTTFNRLALSRFDVGFQLLLEQQPPLRLAAIKDLQQASSRISKICGQSFIRHSAYLTQTYESIKLEGWVSTPDAHRAQTDVQYFFINGRVIKDKVINHAIKLAYADSLPAGRQPGYVLYLTLPLDRIDVNVHPTKHEVRFRDARLIHGLITRAISEALTLQTHAAPTQAELVLPQPNIERQTPARIAESASAYQSQPQTEFRRTLTPAFNKLSHTDVKFTLLHQRYALLLEPEPALIDLQKLDQRYRQHLLSTSAKSGDIASRAILVPIKMSLTSTEAALFHQHHEMLSQLGFVVEIQQQQLTFKRIPYLLSALSLETLKSCLSSQLAITATQNALLQALSDVIPLNPISSSGQAEPLLAFQREYDLFSAEYYLVLDSATLADLFSNTLTHKEA